MPERYRLAEYRGRWAIVYYDSDGERHRISLGTSDEDEAERLAPAIYGEVTRPKGKDVASIWQGYVASMSGRAIVPTMTHTWKALQGRFGPLPADSITDDDCEAHVAARRTAGIKDGTIHTELGHLRMVLRWAEKKKLIDRAPHISRPSKPPARDRHLTRKQIGALRNAASLPHVRLFITLAVGTGARSGALLDLTWDRVDFERGKIDLRNPLLTTPHKGRAVVPMNRMTRAALAAAKPGATTDHVIEWNRAPVASVKRGLAFAARQAGLGKVSPHDLRHSVAVHMAEAGIDFEEIAQFLGHSNVSMARKVYARFSPDHLREAAAVLEYDDLAESSLKVVQ
jgi:integrase